MKNEQVAKAQTRRRGLRIGVVVVGAIVGIFALAWIASNVVGDDDGASTVDSISDTLVDVTEPLSTEPLPVDTTIPVTTSDAVTPGVTTTPPETTDEAPADTTAVATTISGGLPAGCPPEAGADEPTESFDEAPPFCLDPDLDYQAVVTTNLGEFTIALDQEAAPNTVNNFVFLARNLFYDDTPCHRIITDFVVQCGDPTGTGTGGPGYEFDDELPEEGAYELGSVAMANSGANTNGSQWFIVTGPQGEGLAPDYSLFGQVTGGLDTTVADLAALGSSDGTPTAEVEILSVVIETV